MLGFTTHLRTAPDPPSRSVQCYHCRRAFTVPARAMSCSCPRCYKRVTIDDLVVSGNCWAARLQTCGYLTVERRGHLVASVIEARVGMQIDGYVEGQIVSGGKVWLGPRARIRGGITAPSLHIELGAVLDGGLFRVSPDQRLRTTTEPSGLISVVRPDAAEVARGAPRFMTSKVW